MILHACTAPCNQLSTQWAMMVILSLARTQSISKHAWLGNKHASCRFCAACCCVCLCCVCSALCNDSSLAYQSITSSYTRIGESTELALRVFVEKVGLSVS